MKHLKTFDSYVNENVNESNEILNEADVFISDDKFKDEAGLKADIMKNIGPAINKLLKDNGISYNTISAKEARGNRIEFESKPLKDKELGIMMYGFKEVYIDTFGGGSLPKINQTADGKLEFTPYIWFNLHYSYTHGAPWINSQGSNGCPLYLPNESRSDVFYDIVGGVFVKGSEAGKRFNR
jgi:hypothetical protein